MHRRRAVLGALLLGVLLTGCVRPSDAGHAASPAAGTTTAGTAATADATAAFDVDHLGLAFLLPDGFVATDDGGFDFSAERADPVASVTIVAGEIPDGEYPARDGEMVSTRTIDGVEVVVVEGSAMAGLPGGIAANMLLARNGERSFSLIMSCEEADLAAAWSVLMDSLDLTAGAG